MNLRSGKIVGSKPGWVGDKDNPDVHNLHRQLKDLDEDFWDKCPLCNQECIEACECDATDSECLDGHHWHFHQYYTTEEYVKVFHWKGLEKYPCPHNARVGTHACHC